MASIDDIPDKDMTDYEAMSGIEKAEHIETQVKRHFANVDSRSSAFELAIKDALDPDKNSLPHTPGVMIHSAAFTNSAVNGLKNGIEKMCMPKNPTDIGSITMQPIKNIIKTNTTVQNLKTVLIDDNRDADSLMFRVGFNLSASLGDPTYIREYGRVAIGHSHAGKSYLTRVDKLDEAIMLLSNPPTNTLIMLDEQYLVEGQIDSTMPKSGAVSGRNLYSVISTLKQDISAKELLADDRAALSILLSTFSIGFDTGAPTVDLNAICVQVLELEASQQITKDQRIDTFREILKTGPIEA